MGVIDKDEFNQAWSAGLVKAGDATVNDMNRPTKRIRAQNNRRSGTTKWAYRFTFFRREYGYVEESAFRFGCHWVAGCRHNSSANDPGGCLSQRLPGGRKGSVPLQSKSTSWF
jgi:hypothetical protein